MSAFAPLLGDKRNINRASPGFQSWVYEGDEIMEQIVSQGVGYLVSVFGAPRSASFSPGVTRFSSHSAITPATCRLFFSRRELRVAVRRGGAAGAGVGRRGLRQGREGEGDFALSRCKLHGGALQSLVKPAALRRW
jgi:hypothetical protein